MSQVVWRELGGLKGRGDRQAAVQSAIRLVNADEHSERPFFIHQTLEHLAQVSVAASRPPAYAQWNPSAAAPNEPMAYAGRLRRSAWHLLASGATATTPSCSAASFISGCFELIRFVMYGAHTMSPSSCSGNWCLSSASTVRTLVQAQQQQLSHSDMLVLLTDDENLHGRAHAAGIVAHRSESLSPRCV